MALNCPRFVQRWLAFVGVVLVAAAAVGGTTASPSTVTVLLASSLVPACLVLLVWRRRRMEAAVIAPAILLCAVATLLSAAPLAAQDFSRYRSFALDASVAEVSTLTGVAAPIVTTVHQRPALLQTLGWRPSRWTLGSTTDSTDPVEQIVFSFYNDRLFEIVVEYGHSRTEGLTEADMIEAISGVYGPATVAAGEGGPAQAGAATGRGTLLSRWGNNDQRIALYRTASYGEAFRLTVTDLAVAQLAQTAASQAVKLDATEAPQRELARQKKEQEDAAAAAEKARRVNKPRFEP
jgi:hypothetical protein